MAYIEKRGSKWRAQVRRASSPTQTKTFTKKSDAEKWARQVETDIDNGIIKSSRKTMTMRQALQRYKDEVSPTKAGERWETLRIDYMLRTLDFLLFPIDEVTDLELDEWRDKRLKQVSPATVNRELNLIGAVFTAAIKDWKVRMPNPCKLVRRPKQPKHRKRRISRDEIRKIVDACSQAREQTLKWYLGVMFQFAIETGMRKGEIIALGWHDLYSNYVHVENSKNGDSRDVPLTRLASELLASLPRHTSKPFPVLAGSSDASFRKLLASLNIKDLHFHDTRHEACSRLAQKLTVLELAAVIGHRDIRSLQVYYNPTVHEL